MAIDLPEVTQRFLADTAGYLAGLAEMTRAAREFAAANAEAVASVKALNEATARAAVTDAAVAREAGQAAEATFRLSAASQLQVDATRNAAETDAMLAEASHVVTDALDSQARAEGLLIGAERVLAGETAGLAGAMLLGAGATRAASDAMRSAGDTAATTGRTWRLLGTGIRLTGNAIHWLISGTVEFLAVFIPAAAAAASFAAVMIQAATQGYQHMMALYQATEATANIFHKNLGAALGTVSFLQKAQDAIQPGIFQLFGAAIGVATGRMASFWHMGQQVVAIVEQFAARVRVDLSGALGGQITDLLSKGAQDLAMFGQILGNVGHAIVNFASDMPGLAEVLLRVADAISQVILWVSSLPRWLIFTVMAMEEFYRWGGLVARILTGIATVLPRLLPLLGTALVNVFMTAGRIMGGVVQIGAQLVRGIAVMAATLAALIPAAEGASVAMFSFAASMDAAAANPLLMAAIAAAVIALGVLVFALSRVKDATDKWVASSQKAVQSASNLQVLNVISRQAAENAVLLADSQQKLAAQTSYVGRVTGVASRYIQGYSGEAQRTAQDVSELTQNQQFLANTTRTVMGNAEYLARTYHTSFAGALELATQAGVKLTQSLQGNSMAAQVARTQINDLVLGIRAMGAPAGALGSDMEALAAQSALASSDVQKLNQAFDQLTQIVVGGTSDFAQLISTMRAMGSSTAQASSSIHAGTTTVKGDTTALTHSLQGLGSSAINTWQQFDQAISGPGAQLLDWLRTAGTMGVLTRQKFTQAVKDMVAQFVPFAAHSKTATAELSFLAQEAGGPATTSMKVLKDWLGNTKGSAADLKGIVDKTTQSMANLGQIAQNLGNVILQDVTNQMAAAALGTSGAQGAINRYTKALATSGSEAASTRSARAALIKDLENVGLSAHDARGAVRALAATIAGLHSKTVDVNVIYRHYGVPLSAGKLAAVSGYASGIDHAAAGAHVVGEHGPEILMFGGGERVLNNADTRRYLSTPAGGGMHGGGGTGAAHISLTIPVTATLDGETVFSSVKQRTYAYNTRNSGSRTGVLIPT